MKDKRCEKSNRNKCKAKQNESLSKEKKCDELAQLRNNTVTQRQMDNNIGENISVQGIQGAPNATGSTSNRQPTNLDIQRTTRNSSSLAIAPIALISNPPVISNALGAMTSNNMQRILRIVRHVPSNQEQERFIRDISGDEAAEGHLNGQIAIAVPDCRERLNANRSRPDRFRTPLQSSKLYFKHCSDLLMAPKKRRCPPYCKLTKAAAPFILRLP
ncbi:unnamed protein product [Cercopithifilaria johnstoni]|uniref:Uncharacterized protein n=1 Tax=Cercopithifilaria johnstoni TaxID=2874296 RepID=A0A8J2LW43_9BILA|nr:unnamed protein product [Cercopithifilaria johnstoni]